VHPPTAPLSTTQRNPTRPSIRTGGATLSIHSLESAATGALLAVPLVAFRAYTWTPAAADSLPPLSDMHRLMAEEAEPWLSRFNRGHLAAHAAIEVLSTLLLLLPAAQGGIAAGFDFYSSLLQRTLLGASSAAGAAGEGAAAAAAATPEGLGAVLALVITATCAGVVQSLNLNTDEEQLDVVRDAVQNADRCVRTACWLCAVDICAGLLPHMSHALHRQWHGLPKTLSVAQPPQQHRKPQPDPSLTPPLAPPCPPPRYYRLTSMEVGSTADDAARASTAFKAVAVSWMESHEDASALAGAISFLDVVSMSVIWYATGDLTAAAVAALAVAAVDYDNLLKAISRQRSGGRRGERSRTPRGPTPGME